MKIKTRKKSIIIFAALVGFALFCFGLGRVIQLTERLSARRQADALVSQAKYTEAAELYRHAGYGELEVKANELETQAEYERAIALMEGGEPEAARDMLLSLGAYRDSEELLSDCGFRIARNLFESGEYKEALDILGTLPDYPGASELNVKVKAALYAQAKELAKQFRLSEAAEMFECLEDYEDSPQLLKCCRRVSSIDTAKKLLTKEHMLYESDDAVCYAFEEGYLVMPRRCTDDTRFLIYYPGGREVQCSLDFVVAYFRHPAPDTMVFFARTNGLSDFRPRNTITVNKLERLAAEKGLFVHDISVAGSSLGAYVAMQAVLYCREDFGLSADCAMLYDCGSDWLEVELTLNEEQCAKAAEIGTQFLLFEGFDIGMNRPAIVRLVEAGNDVVVVVCANDDHEGITTDALSLGILDWALGDRSEWFEHSNYRFVPLYPGSTYPNDESNPYYQYQSFP